MTYDKSNSFAGTIRTWQTVFCNLLQGGVHRRRCWPLVALPTQRQHLSVWQCVLRLSTISITCYRVAYTEDDVGHLLRYLRSGNTCLCGSVCFTSPLSLLLVTGWRTQKTMLATCCATYAAATPVCVGVCASLVHYLYYLLQGGVHRRRRWPLVALPTQRQHLSVWQCVLH